MNTFIYRDFDIKENEFSYLFELGEYEFRPRWTVSKDFGITLPQNDPMFRRLVFLLGMAELVSYWKCCCPKNVEVVCGSLTDPQKQWWKKLYLNGLGEFFYKNKITPADDFMTIYADTNIDKTACRREISALNGCLVPVGGGKDSAVTLELLAKTRHSRLGYIIGEIKRAEDCAKAAGTEYIKVSRSIDPTLLELNKRGFLNGHTPFSAIVAFSGVLFAYLTGKKYVVLSNESSANESNVADTAINHQYSKSAEFEGDFREYMRGESPALPEYFSLLRPLSEYRITEMFSKMPQYFPVFQSCNAGVKTNTWCLKCAKCLYIYIMLSAFLDDVELIGIFGANLLDDAEFLQTLSELADPKFDKPFECVGTRDEVNFALCKSLERRRDNPPKLLAAYADKIKPSYNRNPGEFFGAHFVPEEFLKLL